ncbi:MAG: hypothetical protein IJU16_08485 [Clostridia bacterium]|nr:hypothetical protein [Clostridia bacterium]
MQEDFHYYATYCAAYMAGYTHDESLTIAYSAQFVDWCSATLLSELRAPRAAATTQLQLELLDIPTDLIGLQDITRVWSSFHFLPGNLQADIRYGSKRYRQIYRLICGPNGELLVSTVELARKTGSLQAVGVAMHVLADTWAHRYFAGTPSQVINNVDNRVVEILPDGTERPMTFRHSASAPDDLDQGIYTSSLGYTGEHSIMNLGHGRAGHLPDYSFIRYRYMPAWGGYTEILKDNPADYYRAFCQMVYAMRYLRGEREAFEADRYDTDVVAPWETVIREILEKRQINACADWKAFAEQLSGETIPDFAIETYQEAYVTADEVAKSDTFLGRFILAAMAQKSMVTQAIFSSGNWLAGVSVDFRQKGFRGIRDYRALIEAAKRRRKA